MKTKVRKNINRILAGTMCILALLIVMATTTAFATEKKPAEKTLIINANVFNGKSEQLAEGMSVLVEGNKITKIAKSIEAPAGAAIIDAGGRTLMPGMIDNHWHVMLAALPLYALLTARDGYINLIAAKQAEATLMRGFTTVRDVGGNPFSLKAVIDSGLYVGPRIYASGPAIGQTSGHSDVRAPAAVPAEVDAPLDLAARSGHFLIADGVPQVLQRVREALRMGASHIKIMAGGGTTSPFDPLDSKQYTLEELKAAVAAAESWNTYVGVHAYTPAQVQQSIEAGVKVIEHGHMIDEETAILMAENGVWLNIQPFLSSEEWMYIDDPFTRAKQEVMFQGTDTAYRLAIKHGLMITWGSDILFAPELAEKQGYMVTLLRKWYTPYEALKMVTYDNAQIFALSGPRDPYPDAELGVIAEGAYADLILVDGNPLEDLELVADPHKNFVLIMKGGKIYKNVVM